MSVGLIRELLELIDIKFQNIDSIPCLVPIEKDISLGVFVTNFEHLSFSVILEPDSAIGWTDSDITEYFIDEETQFFIEEYKTTFTKNTNSVSFAYNIKPEKVQVIELSRFTIKAIEELNRFITDYTAI